MCVWQGWSSEAAARGPRFFENVKCVREPEILVEQQPPQGVLDHAGRVINKFSQGWRSSEAARVTLEALAETASALMEADGMA